MLSLISAHPIPEPRRAIIRYIPDTQKYWGLKLVDFTPYQIFLNIRGILIWLRSHVAKHIKSTIACKMSAYFYFGNSKY